MSPALLLVLGRPHVRAVVCSRCLHMGSRGRHDCYQRTLELNRDSSIIVATVGCPVMFTVSQVAPAVLI
jgi:hypothetical protein